MINFQEEIKRFKPSLDVDNIEDAIVGIDLTDMNDIMVQLAENAFDSAKLKVKQQSVQKNPDNTDEI